MSGASIGVDIVDISMRSISWAATPFTAAHTAKEHSILSQLMGSQSQQSAQGHKKYYYFNGPGISPMMASSILYQEIGWPLVCV